MSTVRSRSVYRYFIPADSFVRILLTDGRGDGAPAVRARPGLNRSDYRRLVIEACCPEFRTDPAEKLADLSPHDPLAGEDLLYQLCIEVNPHLDIHTVRLPGAREDEAGGQEDAEAESTPATQEQQTESPDAWLVRLRRASRHLAERLSRHVIGQERAIETVARLVRKSAAGLAEEGRPMGSFLLIGRTGTGKTELARRLARELYEVPGGGRPALVRIDCSEYALAHEYAKLIGAPPGYVGHEHGGFLTDALRKTPECVVLFDEVEKAHPKVHQLLLQVLDEGHLTDSRGRRADFSRALVVLTSNVGAVDLRDASQAMGFAPGGALASETLGEITARALERQFSPEFLGRLDERILFRDLTPEDARAIASRRLADLARRVRKRRRKVAFTPAVAGWVAERGWDPATGARELRRVIQREVEAPLAELFLAGTLRQGQLVRISVRAGQLAFRAI